MSLLCVNKHSCPVNFLVFVSFLLIDLLYVPMAFPPPTPPSPPLQSSDPSFLLRKGQAFCGYLPSLAYQVAVRLGRAVQFGERDPKAGSSSSRAAVWAPHEDWAGQLFPACRGLHPACSLVVQSFWAPAGQGSWFWVFSNLTFLMRWFSYSSHHSKMLVSL